LAGTLIGIFLETVARYHKPAQFMSKRAGRWESIAGDTALAEVESLGLGLSALGIQPGDRVAILSETRYEWAIADLAILGIGAVTVPLYASLTAEQCRFILEDSEAVAAVVSAPAQLEKLHLLADRLPRLRSFVHIDPAAPGHPKDVAWDALVARGAAARAANPGAFRERAARVSPGDLATIIYTSGTTGDPKGAMLVHSNIASNVEACLQVIDLGPADTMLSFLPLSHIFERMAGLYAMLAAGTTIAYAESMEQVAANAVEVRPTILTGVPRFYEKIYARVMENALGQPALRKRIFFWGLHQGMARARARFEGRRLAWLAARRAAIADRLVGAKVRARVGGRLRFCISGGAPLAPKVMEFFFAVGIPVIEGYGLTETSPVICLNRLGHEKPGSVGPPIPGVEVRIGEDGEILTRGPHVMKGYFKNDEATRQALRDGWFHTGDVGKLDPEGALAITDRLKDLLVTAGGKKVAPQPLEGRLKTSKWVSEAVLLGDRQPYVVSLIVPNFANLEAEARSHGRTFVSHRDLIGQPEIQALIQAEVDKLNGELAPFEKIKRFALLDRDLSQEAGELTPTLKVRRRVVAERFADVIQELYGTPSQGAAGDGTFGA
jgi:long-chain acyl-CoA synthetase